jgi:16S rRNA (adenine1518-N6/adenine1519-N6)-dimethyltransferase
VIHPKQILAQYQVEPKRSLGQNFLFDDNILTSIVAAAELVSSDRVLEIGAGLGNLTRLLARQAEAVIAIELDQRLIPILQADLATFENVQLVQGDILRQDVARWFSEPYKVVANIPYYITGSILRHLLSAERRPELMVLTVQKEVAERIVASPPRMSLLAISVQYYAQASIVGEIRAGAFWPRPDVDSAVVRIDLINDTPSEVEGIDRFFRVVKAGFSQRRKQVKNNLRNLGFPRDSITAALTHAGIDGRRRAETLDVGEWVALTEALHDDG